MQLGQYAEASLHQQQNYSYFCSWEQKKGLVLLGGKHRGPHLEVYHMLDGS